MKEQTKKEKGKKKERRSTDLSLIRNICLVNKTLFRNYPETIWATPVYIVSRVVLPLLTAVIPSVAIAAITEGDAPRFLWMMLGILLVEFLAQLSMDYCYMMIMNRRVYTRLKVFFMRFVKKSLTTDYVNFEPAKCQAEFTKGAKAIVGNGYGPEKLMRMSVEFLIQALGLTTFGVVVFRLDYRILLILLFMVALDFVLRGSAVNYSNKNRMILSEVHRKQEYLERGSLTLAAGKDVRVYQMEGWFHQIMEKLLVMYRTQLKKVGLRWFIPSFGNQVCVAAQEIVTYFVLIGMVAAGKITIAEFTLQLGLVRGFSQWVYHISVCYGELKKANDEMNDYHFVMKKEDRYVESTDDEGKREKVGGKESERERELLPMSAVTGGPEIEFRDLSFCYLGEDTDTLSHINFTIRPGEKLALVGNNGAGKTTLVKLLCGLYEPTSGQILVNGTDITKVSLTEYQKLLSVVFQDVSLLSFTIEMNITGKQPNPEAEERVKEVLKKVGLWEKVEKLPDGIRTYITQDLDENGVQFSGGETQRLLLARAMYRNGPILILDEPTSALDPIAESRLYEEYNELTAEKTSLFISHRLASTKFCDRILLLDEGRIAEVGSHEELMEKHGLYRELFDIQSHYYKEGVTEHEDETEC